MIKQLHSPFRGRVDAPAVTPPAVPFIDVAAQHAPLRTALLEAVGRVIDHGQFVLGPEVEALERRWASACHVKHAVSVSNGTDALFLVLKALGVGPGDEVITAPNSFLASASCIVMTGAVPRFCDVGDDFNIDADVLPLCITPRTRAIIAVHLAGRPAEMERILSIAEAHGLWVIEDAAQAFGARCQGRPVGGLARAACFSLHPLKTAGACGDGGMITTDEDLFAQRLRLLRNHGLRTRQEDCEAWGYNMRLDTIQAAMMLVKLEHHAGWVRRRRAIAERMRERLSDVLRLPPDRPGDHAVYQTFLAEADRRDELVEHLRARDIGCAVHYPKAIHQLTPATGMRSTHPPLPVAERQAQRIISLPVHQDLSDEQVDRVCDEVETFYRGS